MLEQVLNYIHNYFEVNIVRDKFVISSGSIDIGFLQPGQYFRIKGSVFNDGVYQFPAEGLHDEEFSGEVWAMAVPPSVIALVADIEKWVDDYGSVIDSPYQSESFGGYSYSKASGSNSGSGSVDWQDVFRNRLNQRRKIC
jgi:hypothetical protein